MSVTAQTNTTLEEIAEHLLKADSICICGHVSPDGDAIGSGLALKCALKSFGKDITMLLADDVAKLDPKYDFLPGSESYIHAKSYKGVPDVFVCVDVPNAQRLGYSASVVHARSKLTITVDHHADDGRMSQLSYTDPDAASTTVLIWRLAQALGITLDRDIATCALSGLMTDTGSFQYQNADKEAFDCAAQMVSCGADPNEISTNFFQRKSIASIKLEAITISNMKLFCDGQAAISYITREDMKNTHATKADCDTLINVLRSIDGVRVACILKEMKDDIRGSLRSKDNTDVASLAARFNGGGHKAAAGFTMHGKLDAAINEMIANISELIEGESA